MTIKTIKRVKNRKFLNFKFLQMVEMLSGIDDSLDVDFKGFKQPEGSDIAFSQLSHENTPLVLQMDVEALSDISEFMDTLQLRVVIEDHYASAALHEIEKNAIIAFEKLPLYKDQIKREMFYEDLLTLKLKTKKGKWVFTCNDRSFTPQKHGKVSAGVKLEVVFSPGFYYTETHCGVYLTLKSVNFPKTKTVKK